jgi:D-alanyl-D-alanine dipeptidase
MAGSAPSNPLDPEPDRGLDAGAPPSGGAQDPLAVSGALRHQRLVRDLLPGATPPSFSFESLTRRPEQVGLDAARLGELVPAPAPMAPLTIPEDVAPVHAPVPLADDPLQPVAGPGIRVLGAYRGEGWPHTVEGAHLRHSVVERLARVAADLPEPFALAVFDAWRPLPLQAALFDSAYADPDLPPGFVAEADPDPTTPPAHLTGGTVDLTLSYDGIPLALGTPFDDFRSLAHADHLEQATPIDEASRVVRDLRRLLVASMAAEGFVVLHCEWWHFEHGTRYWAAVTGGTARFGPAALEPG